MDGPRPPRDPVRAGPAPADRIAVMVVDDQPAFRAAATEVLCTASELEVSGSAESGEAALASLLFDPFDRTALVLMDINMPGMGGIEAARRVHALRPELVVLLMSTYDVRDLPDDTSTCGATGYVRKEELTPALLVDLWRATGRPAATGRRAATDP
jgi:DNA-binding NarL/FixJ family response regulator